MESIFFFTTYGPKTTVTKDLFIHFLVYIASAFKQKKNNWRADFFLILLQSKNQQKRLCAYVLVAYIFYFAEKGIRMLVFVWYFKQLLFWLSTTLIKILSNHMITIIFISTIIEWIWEKRIILNFLLHSLMLYHNMFILDIISWKCRIFYIGF
jgi:hypothetical protein